MTRFALKIRGAYQKTQPAIPEQRVTPSTTEPSVAAMDTLFTDVRFLDRGPRASGRFS